MSCQPANFFLLRTPLLPFDRWRSWTGDSAGDESALRKGLREALTPVFHEALYLASPDLCRALKGWLEDPQNRRSRAVESALVAYFSRSADRATPFGLFAGITNGHIAQDSNLELPAQAQYQKKIRLDLRYLDALSKQLDEDADATYRPNTTIFRLKGKIRYLESRVDELTGFRHFRLVDCQLSHVLEIALEAAKLGARSDAIIAKLVECGGTLEDAQNFFASLVEAQLLVPDSLIRLSGDDPSDQLLQRMTGLAATQRALSALERKELGSGVTAYEAIESRLPTIHSADATPRFFVDLLKPSETCSLGRNIVNELRAGIELVRKIARPEPDRLELFKQSFAERYGSSEVPLLEALDGESGIRLSRFRRDSGTDIINGVFRSALTAESTAWTSYEESLMRAIAPCLSAEKKTLELQPRDLKDLASDNPPVWPNLFAVNVRFFAESTKELDSGNFKYTLLGYLAGPALLGRFASADPELRCQLQRWLQSEADARPDCVFAEILHVPQGEPLSQIICRPRFYQYQIPILAACSVPDENRIALSDLKVSIRDDLVLLRSERLNRQIVPRLPVAHNFRKGTNLQLYRFLCELQYQKPTASAMWTWPAAMQKFTFLPRLTHGHLILSLARWRIEADEIEQLSAIAGTDLMPNVNRWRNERRMPRFVRLFESDCHIPIDFENILSIRCLIRSIRRSAFAFVEEMPENGLCMRSSTESFQHEATIPFTAESMPRLSRIVCRAGARHSFAPGSEWVYAKIYASPRQTDALLAAQVPNLLRSARGLRVLEKWFFIRYADPECHLRLRLRAQPGCEADLLLSVQKQTRCWIADGFCWRIQFDTYLPEVDRYGGPAASELAEEVFCADSEAVLDVIRVKNRPRWLLAMLGVDALLSDFGLSSAERLAWSTEVRDAFQQEFSRSAERRQLGVQHRSHRAAIRQAFAGTNLFALRSERIRPIAHQLAAMGCGDGQMIAHYTHMHVNRMLPMNQRQSEFVLYDFLCRWYTEQIATAIDLAHAD